MVSARLRVNILIVHRASVYTRVSCVHLPLAHAMPKGVGDGNAAE